VGDEKTPAGQMSNAVKGLFSVFGGNNFPARNAHGIFTATVQKDKNQLSSDGELKNPFVVTCDTFTFTE